MTEDKLSMPGNKNVQEDNSGIVVMRDLTPEEYEKYLYEMREKRLHDEANALNSAEKRGREEERIRIAENLRKMGMTEEEIKNALGK